MVKCGAVDVGDIAEAVGERERSSEPAVSAEVLRVWPLSNTVLAGLDCELNPSSRSEGITKGSI